MSAFDLNKLASESGMGVKAEKAKTPQPTDSKAHVNPERITQLFVTVLMAECKKLNPWTRLDVAATNSNEKLVVQLASSNKDRKLTVQLFHSGTLYIRGDVDAVKLVETVQAIVAQKEAETTDTDSK